MTIYVVVGYILGYSPTSPKLVDIKTNISEAERIATNFCARFGSGGVRKVHDGYFTSEIGKSEYAEARIYEKVVNADANPVKT